MPVGGRDDRLARADGVGERAGDDLLTIKVRSDIDVGRADKLDQLIQPDELGVEYDLLLDATLSGKPLQHQAVGFAIMAADVRMRRAWQHVADVRLWLLNSRHFRDVLLAALLTRQK